MFLRLFCLTVIVWSLQGCAAPPAPISAYNQGVHAYQAKDFASARVHWQKAIDEGEVSAENNLGYLLFYGFGGAVDTQRGIALWRDAAAKGHPESQWHLGVVYAAGEAVEPSRVEAYAWFRCAIASAESNSREHEDIDASIAVDARKSLEKLLGKLTKEQFESGESLAKQYIRAYAHGG